MKPYIYKDLIYDENAIMTLYAENGWTAYTKNKEALFRGIRNSLDTIGVYDQEQLIGFIRTIGDQETIIYIQDILVLPKYQRQGIGKKLLTDVISKYDHVRQIILTTDNTEKTRLFYESVGMIGYDKINCLGYMVKK